MNILDEVMERVNRFQQRHSLTAIIFAVIKKYSEENAGRQAALLTYYSFLSLFPLLLVVTTLTDTFLIGHPYWQATIIRGVNRYFPLLGNQLAQHVHSLKQSGLALIVGLLFTIYGARGVANAFINSVQRLWHVPKNVQIGFLHSLVKSLTILVVGGIGFIVASILAGLTAGVGHELLFRILSLVVNLGILFWLFSFLINQSLPKQVPLSQIRIGAAFAAIGLIIMQLLGGYILAHELKNLDALYSYFAISLGLLFWVYLQVQVLLYSIELALVTSNKLWPRSINDSQLTEVDKQIVENRLR
jgi:YihY family inner membrane protein